MWFDSIDFSVRFYENQAVPDIFIYLVNEKNQRICFRRHSVDLEEGIPNEWRMLKPDLTMIQVHS